VIIDFAVKAYNVQLAYFSLRLPTVFLRDTFLMMPFSCALRSSN